MAIIKTEAIVLSGIPQGETSRILRLLTRDRGRVSVIAKGARKWKNRFGGTLEALNRIDAVYYYKESRDLQILTQADVICAYQDVKNDLGRLTAGLAAAEIIQQLHIGEDESESTFALFTGLLGALDSPGLPPHVLYWRFLMRFLAESGFEMSVNDCRMCGAVVEIFPAAFSLRRGGVLCPSCAGNESVQRVSEEAVRALRSAQNSPVKSLGDMTVSDSAVAEIFSLLDRYYRYHFDDFTTPNAIKLMN